MIILLAAVALVWVIFRPNLEKTAEGYVIFYGTPNNRKYIRL